MCFDHPSSLVCAANTTFRVKIVNTSERFDKHLLNRTANQTKNWSSQGKGSNWDLFSNQYLFQEHEKNPLSFTMQGSHTDWKTWKNGKTFSSQGILCRLEKSGKFGQNTGKVRET